MRKKGKTGERGFWKILAIRKCAEDLEGLTEASYNRLADGSRAEKRNIKIDPQTADAIKRAFPTEAK